MSEPSPSTVNASEKHPEILAAVLDFLTSTFPDSGETLSASTRLEDGHLLDSLAFMEVIMFLEREFDLSVERRDLGAGWFDTPERIVELVLHKQRQPD